MSALAEPDKAVTVYPQGLSLAMGLASLAPAMAWTAHTLLGLRLEPGNWNGWAGSGAAGSLSAWIWALALAPVVEETAMRPLLQTGLRHQLERIQTPALNQSLDAWGHLASLATALVFAVLHMPANGVLALWWIFPALAIGEVWRRSERWLWCVLLHAWFNASLAAVTALSGVA